MTSKMSSRIKNFLIGFGLVIIVIVIANLALFGLPLQLSLSLVGCPLYENLWSSCDNGIYAILLWVVFSLIGGFVVLFLEGSRPKKIRDDENTKKFNSDGEKMANNMSKIQEELETGKEK